MQQVDDEHIRDQVDRCSAVAELVEQPFDALFRAHRQGDVHLVDITGSRALDQCLMIAAHGYKALNLVQVDRIAGLIVIESDQIETHPWIADDIGGKPPPQRACAHDGDGAGVVTVGTQGTHHLAQSDTVATEDKQACSEPAESVTVGEQVVMQQEVIGDEHADKGCAPITRYAPVLSKGVLTPPGTVQLADIIEQVEQK